MVRVLVLLTLFRVLYFKNVRLVEGDGFRHAVGSCTLVDVRRRKKPLEDKDWQGLCKVGRGLTARTMKK